MDVKKNISMTDQSFTQAVKASMPPIDHCSDVDKLRLTLLRYEHERSMALTRQDTMTLWLSFFSKGLAAWLNSMRTPQPECDEEEEEEEEDTDDEDCEEETKVDLA